MPSFSEHLEKKRRSQNDESNGRQQSSDDSLHIVDNRPEAIAQRKLQQLANDHLSAKPSLTEQSETNGPFIGSSLQSKHTGPENHKVEKNASTQSKTDAGNTAIQTENEASQLHKEEGNTDLQREKSSKTHNSNVIQRLVGFEIESSNIPVTPAGAGHQGIANFLTDGFGPGQKFGANNNTWYRETDHSIGLSTRLERIRALWQQAATANAGELAKVRDPAIVEYVTSPFDERSANSYRRATGWFSSNLIHGTNDMTGAIGQIVADINHHRNNLMTAGGSQMGIPGRAQWLQAAIHHYQMDPQQIPLPQRVAVQALMGIRTNSAFAFAGSTYDAVAAQIANDEQNVQATMGILPEKILNLLALAADNTQAFNTLNHAPNPISAQNPDMPGAGLGFIGQLMNAVDARTGGLVNALTGVNGTLKTTDQAEKDALEGYLRLVLYTTLGSVAWGDNNTNGPAYVGGVPKNMISFLPKTPLHLIAKALPYSVRTSSTYFGFNGIVNQVMAEHTHVGNQMAGWGVAAGAFINAGRIAGTDGGIQNPLTVPVRNYISAVLGGKNDPFFFAQAAGRPALKPEDPDKGGRKGILTKESFFFDERTNAVALETRHNDRRLTAAELPAYANNIRDLVMAANA